MDIWKHGKYLDLWSLVHFLSGFLLCGLFYWINLDLTLAFIISAALLIFWEVIEFIIKIIEPSWNVAVDIVVGIIGFFLASYIYFVREEFSPTLYLAVVTATFLIALWGFLDFLKKGYR